MANTYSALKRMRMEQRRTRINRMRKTRLRHAIRAMRQTINKKDAGGAQSMLPKTFSMIDRAAKWGIVKKNTAARYKSRITASLKRLAAA
jgi:small subunit ribosomal protein S20